MVMAVCVSIVHCGLGLGEPSYSSQDQDNAGRGKHDRARVRRHQAANYPHLLHTHTLPYTLHRGAAILLLELN